MTNIGQILNMTAELRCVEHKEFVVVGILVERDGDIIFAGTSFTSQPHELPRQETVSFVGKVGGHPVTLRGAHMQRISASYSIDGSPSIDCEIRIGSIIIGKKYEETAMVSRIQCEFDSLKLFGLGMPLKVNFEHYKPLVEYVPQQEIKAVDKDGVVQILQTTEIQCGINQVNLKVHHYVEYAFLEQKELMDAVKYIACFRVLLTFLSNCYIEMEDFEFYEKKDDISGYTLKLLHSEKMINEDLFLILASDVVNGFQEIWTQWRDFYENNYAVAELFYEIICNRSTYFNEFLNLCQAMEVYSSRSRENEAYAIYQSAKLNGENSKGIKFAHRLKDLFSVTNDFFDLSETQMDCIARNLAAMRNYYTHYNESKYRKPDIQEVFSASGIIRFLLLIIVYKRVGISPNAIREIRSRVVAQRVDEDLKTIIEMDINREHLVI